ncbi:MAG: bifunctional nuclease family protein [Methanoregulaceae archaeon]
MSEPVCGIEGVFVAETPGGVSPVVLLSIGQDRCLPIYIGIWEAISIGSALRGEVPPRPFTHDLFSETLQKFGISVLGLNIDSIEDGVFYATLLMARDQLENQVDCRPSDGIALALRSSAPISVDESVVAEAGVKRSDLPDLSDIASYLAS